MAGRRAKKRVTTVSVGMVVVFEHEVRDAAVAYGEAARLHDGEQGPFLEAVERFLGVYYKAFSDLIKEPEGVLAFASAGSRLLEVSEGLARDREREKIGSVGADGSVGSVGSVGKRDGAEGVSDGDQ